MIFKALPWKHESSFLEMSLVMNETYSSESNHACNLTFKEEKEKKIRKQTLSVIRLLCIRITSQTVSSFFFLLLSISGREREWEDVCLYPYILKREQSTTIYLQLEMYDEQTVLVSVFCFSVLILCLNLKHVIKISRSEIVCVSLSLSPPSSPSSALSSHLHLLSPFPTFSAISVPRLSCTPWTWPT